MTEQTEQPRTHPHAYPRLAQLGAALSAKGFGTQVYADRVLVIAPADRGPRPADEITCRTRADDGGRLWFWTSWDEPIAEADHITDTVVVVTGNLRAEQ